MISNISLIMVGSGILLAFGTAVYELVKRLIIGVAIELVTIGIYVTLAAIVTNAILAW